METVSWKGAQVVGRTTCEILRWSLLGSSRQGENVSEEDVGLLLPHVVSRPENVVVDPDMRHFCHASMRPCSAGALVLYQCTV